jgi:hypothetical protein
MSFASDVRELREDLLSMLETHHDEFIDFPPHSYSHVPPRFYSRTSPRTSSRVFPQFSYGLNHSSYGFGSQENRFEPRRFDCDSRPHRGDHLPRRSGFSTEGSYTYFEPRHLYGLHFPRRGSRPTRPSGEVQRTVKTSSDRMVSRDFFWSHRPFLVLCR